MSDSPGGAESSGNGQRAPAQDSTAGTVPETFNPWSVVNLVFHHLADEGLHPVLGATGDPGVPAAELLRALGIAPTVEGNRRVRENVHDQLAELRVAFGSEPESAESAGGSGQQSPASR